MRTRLLLPLFAALAAGCGSDPVLIGDPGRPTPAAPDTGSAFDAAKTGTVNGMVTWHGPIPTPPPFLFCTPRSDGLSFEYKQAENPNRPRVDPKTRAVTGAVVFLRGIDPARSKAWDHPRPVRVEVRDGQITVEQGEGGTRGRSGFVRRGDAIEVRSADKDYQILRARGDAFFSLPLPDDQPVTRTLNQPGRVELSSGTGRYWARADLFVADHPYFTLTDTAGRFRFEQVPDGNVEVVVWLPGWEVGKQERDPDTTAIARMSYSAPVERAKPVAVPAGGVAAPVPFSVP